MSHQPLPANEQAQTLPAKWVIKVTDYNQSTLIQWANRQLGAGVYDHDNTPIGFYMHSELVYCGDACLVETIPYTGFTLITDAQFKAMVEGEGRPKWEGKLNQECQKMENAEERAENIKLVYDLLIELESYETAAEWKAKHPDIWPVDYAKALIEAAINWGKLYDGIEPLEEGLEGDKLLTAVRNYLNNQK